MNEETYLELKNFVESYEKRHILDRHPNGDKTLTETKQRIKDYENKKDTKICGRFHVDSVWCNG